MTGQMGQMDRTTVAPTLLGLVAIVAGAVIGLGALWYIAPQVALVLIGGGLVGSGVLINALSHNHAHALDEARRDRAMPLATRGNDDTARIVQTVVQALQSNGGGFVIGPPAVYTDRRNGHERVEGTDYYGE